MRKIISKLVDRLSQDLQNNPKNISPKDKDVVTSIKSSDGQVIMSVYEGKIIDQMPRLIESGQTPMSIKEIMEEKVKAWYSSDTGLAEQWWGTHYDSGDSIMHHTDGRIKIVPNSQSLRGVNRNSPLEWSGAIVLQEGTFDNTEGVEFTSNEAEKFTLGYYNIHEALENPVLIALAQGDKELLREYLSLAFPIKKTTKICLWARKYPFLYESERIWRIVGNPDEELIDSSGSVKGNNNDQLDDPQGRLIGVPNRPN